MLNKTSTLTRYFIAMRSGPFEAKMMVIARLAG
jgi:hypothetical protein